MINRSGVCWFHHHLGEHGPYASCSGKAPLDIVWRLGVPQVAQAYRNGLRLDRECGHREAAWCHGASNAGIVRRDAFCRGWDLFPGRGRTTSALEH